MVLTAFVLICVLIIYKIIILINERKMPDNVLIDPQKKNQFKVVFNKELTHDTRLIRFNVTNKQLYLPIGQHIYLSARVNGEDVERPYAPASVNNGEGYFDLVVKVFYIYKLSI